MKYLVVLACLFLAAEAYTKSANPFKTKKYKCVEVSDDEEIQIVQKKVRTFNIELNMEKSFYRSSQLQNTHGRLRKRRLNTGTRTRDPPRASRCRLLARLASISSFVFEMCLAQVKTQKIIATTPPTVSDVQRDAKGRPLILSPEHCKQVLFQTFGLHSERIFRLSTTLRCTESRTCLDGFRATALLPKCTSQEPLAKRSTFSLLRATRRTDYFSEQLIMYVK